MVRVGVNYAAGRTIDGRAGVWDIARGGPPVEAFPADKDGWAALWSSFERADTPAPAPTGRSESARWLGFAVLVVILVVVYVLVHAHRYSGCVVSPGLFAWPDACF